MEVSVPNLKTRRRILVVDDNYDAAYMLALLLKIGGDETHTAHDGQEALERAAAIRPEIIILDIGLPKLNGYEVCRSIREQPWGRPITMVAVTGWAREEDRQKSEEAGFNGHLAKPVDHRALTELVAELQAKVN